jgi:hypothetical protein
MDTRRIDIDVVLFNGKKFSAVLIVDGDYDRDDDLMEVHNPRIEIDGAVLEALVRADCDAEMEQGL